MTAETIAAEDALSTEIREAQQAGNTELAQALYQKQQGVDPDNPYGLAGLPAVAEDQGDDAPAPAPVSGELTVATGADADDVVTVSPEWDFAGNPEHVAHQIEEMRWWDRQGGDDPYVDGLLQRWGSDVADNLAAAYAFELALPNEARILRERGYGGDPALIEVMASLGRRFAPKPGDFSQIMTRKGNQQMADNTENIQDLIDEMEDEIERLGQDPGMSAERNRLHIAQQELYRKLDSGSIVGSGGRTV